MTRTPMARSSIARLNAAARRYERAGADGPEAVLAAASDAGLIAVADYDESGVLFRTLRNRFVFAWTNHASVAAGCGFDDQITTPWQLK